MKWCFVLIGELLGLIFFYYCSRNFLRNWWVWGCWGLVNNVFVVFCLIICFWFIKIVWFVIFWVKFILCVIIIIVCFFCVSWWMVFRILFISFGFSVDVGLLNKIILGCIVSVCVIVICCCWLLDKWCG